MFLANVSGLTRVAGIGEAAPGGGHFSAFGTWPGIGPQASVIFVAAVDDGPEPAGLFVSRKGTIERIAAVGEPLAGGGRLATFAMNPAPAAGPNGGMTFATMAAGETGRSAIYNFGLPAE